MERVVRKAHGDPTLSTFGNVGDLYVNLDTNTMYRCTRADTKGKDLGFVTVYQREGVNTTYVWETVAAEESETYILIDETGKEIPAVLVESETVFTAGPNDIREGMVAATDDGVTVGTKEIPVYIANEGVVVVPVGSVFTVPIYGDQCEYTKFQALICKFNGSLANSVGTIKVSINDNTYNVDSTDILAAVTPDAENKQINLGISNEETVPCIIRYFTFKEEY